MQGEKLDEEIKAMLPILADQKAKVFGAKVRFEAERGVLDVKREHLLCLLRKLDYVEGVDILYYLVRKLIESEFTL